MIIFIENLNDNHTQSVSHFFSQGMAKLKLKSKECGQWLLRICVYVTPKRDINNAFKRNLKGESSHFLQKDISQA